MGCSSAKSSTPAANASTN
ncbi:unnamed protein product, partial [Didymodactylos carnosus]